MFKSLFNKTSGTNEDFLAELLKPTLNIENLKGLVTSDKVNINHQNNEGNSFLNICILKNKAKSAEWLIDNGIQLTLVNNDNKDCLALCIEKENHLLFNKLLKTQKSNINQLDHNKRTLLQNAVISGQNKIIKPLLANGADVNSLDDKNRNVAFDALLYGDEAIINLIISTPDIDLNVIDVNGETILHNSSIIDNKELIRNLILNGADPTISDTMGRNLLCTMALVGMDNLDLIELSIEQGFSLNTVGHNKNTILMETLSAFYEISEDEKDRRESLLEMADILVEKGLDVNALNEYGENALFDAIRRNDYKTSALLIKNKIDVNKKNRLNQRPILLACYKGVIALDIILLLLDNGANPSLRNELDQDVFEIMNQLILHLHKFKMIKCDFLLMYLDENGQYLVILKELINNTKFKSSNLDSKGQPLFFDSILYGDIELFNLYMTKDFDINSTNRNGLNLFFVYVDFVFKINRFFPNFKVMLIKLISAKADINVTNKSKQNIFFHVINSKTDIKLYKVLLDVCRCPYLVQDKQGRTLSHQAVLNKNVEVLRLINSRNDKVTNVEDYFGILPLTYAGLLGSTDIVIEILGNKHAYLKSNKKVPLIVREKFLPMIGNLNSLLEGVTDKDDSRKIAILIDQIRLDFKI